MSPDKRSPSQDVPTDEKISIGGNVVGSNIIVGDNNTIIQKFFNIFKSEAESLEHRNRRILLNHVENGWIKGVLDASLHGAALLDLGIKEDRAAVNRQYPWAIKKEATDETLPAGTSMLEIFENIGMGRALLILGKPGAGKTTMLLELARQLIARARQDESEPIPMVFNLASWTEKLTLADWLAQELNKIYLVPRKTAPDWVKGNKLLLLLDGLDEVKGASRAGCVAAINAFRGEHGMTSLAVCSRSQDYADLGVKLTFDGAIEVQPLTGAQAREFLRRFGEETAGIGRALKKDAGLQEMAETPLFLSIMLMAYRGKRDAEILISGDDNARRRRLFDTYIERMFERRPEHAAFKKQDVLRYLSWLASKMVEHNAVPYLIEDMQPEWLGGSKQIKWYILVCKSIYMLVYGIIYGLTQGLIFGLAAYLIAEFIASVIAKTAGIADLIAKFAGLVVGQIGLISGLVSVLYAVLLTINWREKISTVDSVSWDWNYLLNRFAIRKPINKLFVLLHIALILGLVSITKQATLIAALFFALSFGLMLGWEGGLNVQPVDRTTYPAQKISLTVKNSFLTSLFSGLLVGLLVGLGIGFFVGLYTRISAGFYTGLFAGLSAILMRVVERFNIVVIIRHYVLRLFLAINNLLPWKLVPFLDHCAELIFLRRVGGGYIFVHRLLMEHFAEGLNHDLQD